MRKQYIAGGVGKALLFLGDNLVGIANTLSDNTFNFSITSEEIRGGKKNVLLGNYFHDSNLAINLTNALFNFDDISLVLGANIAQGGLSFKEEAIVAGEGTLTVSQTPLPVHGELIGWYKQKQDANWQVGTFAGKEMTASVRSGETYCVKYFWSNPDARVATIRADYEPSELHLLIIQDLFTTEQQEGEVKAGERAGALITDIPRFKLDGNLDLGFAAGSTATTSLSGNALAVEVGNTCEEEFIYGTMTEEIVDAKWQDNVIAIAIENGDVDLAQKGKEELKVRVVYGGTSPAQRKSNDNFTFKVEEAPASTASGTSVAPTGVITAGSTNGSCVVSVKLKGNEKVEPAYVLVTVAGA